MTLDQFLRKHQEQTILELQEGLMRMYRRSGNPPPVSFYDEPIIEDIECEVIEPKQLEP